MRFEITERSEFAQGESFGEVGPYERIVGRIHYAIDPSLPQNQAIIDLKLAPKNDEGLVEFSSDLFMLAPKDLSKGNGAVFYDVNNRGNKLALRFFNDAPGGNDADDAGHGFLMRQGYTVVWHGWDGELLPGGGRLQLFAPMATERGQTITGRVRYEICVEESTNRTNINRANHGAYRPTEDGLKNATLTWRLRAGDRRAPIPSEQFRLHVVEVDSESSGQLPQVDIELLAGFEPGYLYELIYEAQDPLVHGVCFASLRDLIAAFKQGEGESNPLLIDEQPAIERAFGFGVSQSGRFLREFLYSGFNADESGRKVFDGLIPHVAGGGLGSFNHRFAQPTAYVTQHEHHDWPTDRFPFAYEDQVNPYTGRHDGILRKSETDGVAPRVMHTQSSTEYWSRSGSLVHTDPLAKRDADVPEGVRIYAFGGTQHGPSGFPPSKGNGQTLANPGDYRPLLRALLVSLDRWCRDDTPPPPSRYPRLADGTAVAWDQPSTGFPAIPGVRYPEVIQQPAELELGPRWLVQGLVETQPPREGGRFKVVVARCGADGNETGCLSPPEVAIPLATFTGWSLRNREVGPHNELVGLNGSYIPLPKTKSERAATGDPRKSLEERYGGMDGYLEQLHAACQEMVAQGYLLNEDVPRVIDKQTKIAAGLFVELEE